MGKESFWSTKLKDLDTFKRLPSKVSKGSVVGVILSTIMFLLICALVINEVFVYLSFQIESGLKIDHKRENSEVEVHINISFPNHPCHLLGLDVVDYVGTHKKNQHDNLKRFALDSNGKVMKEVGFDLEKTKLKSEFLNALKTHQGCRIKGYFNVLLVPGNFHIGFHSFASILREIIVSNGPFEVDFRHVIHSLYFGKKKQHLKMDQYISEFKLKHLNVLEERDSSLIAKKGPFSFKYKLLVLETNLIYENLMEEELFQYRSFWNVAYFEQTFNYMISFDYELSPVTLTEKRVVTSFNDFLIHTLGIVGGMVAFSTLLHTLLQKSVLKVMHKHSLGKYN